MAWDLLALRGEPTDSLRVLGYARFDGVPEGLAVDARVIRSRLAFPDGALVTFDGHGQDSAELWSVFRWDPELVRRTLGGVSFLNPEHVPNPPLLLSLVNRSMFRRHSGANATYTASVMLTVLTYDLRGARPLARQAHGDQGWSRVAVLTMDRDREGVVVFARETIIQLLFKGEPKWFGAATWWELSRRVLYVLRNRARGEALWPMPDPAGDVDPIMMFDAFSERRLKQRLRRLVYHSSTPFSDEWLTGAELVRIEANEIDTFSRDVRIEPFVLPPSLK